MRFSALVAIALLAYVATVAANPFPVCSGSTGWNVASSVYYDQNTGRTVFSYTVSSSGEDISRFIVPRVGSCATLYDPEGDWTYETEHLSGQAGYVAEVGLDAADGSKTYTLEFQGAVGSSSQSAGLVGEDCHSSQSVIAPDCGASNEYPTIPAHADEQFDCVDKEDALETPSGASDRIVAGRCENDFVIFRTISASSDGLTSHLTYRVIVSDNQGPSFSHFNTTEVVECGIDAEPTIPDVEGGLSDNCDEKSNVELSYCEERVNKTCPADYFITRTWTATDSCGNSNCITQTIVHQDTRPPIIDTKPEDVTLECTPDVEIPTADAGDITYHDDCQPECFEGEPNPVSFTEREINGECGLTREIQRTWSITDCCGNTATARQIVRVVDTTPPQLNFTGPYDSQFECDETIVVPEPVSSDDCMETAPFIPEPRNVTIGNSTCNYQIKYTWTIMDDCWNSATLNAYLTVQDNTKPTFNQSTLPADATYQCGEVPSETTPEGSDNCHDVTIEFFEHTADTECANEKVINRTWVITDECDNSNQYTQIITQVDTQPPVFTNIPADATYGCIDEVPAQPCDGEITFAPEEFPECDNTYNLTCWEDRPSESSCDNTITRHWRAVDCSGNIAEATQTITVNDITPPALGETPANTTVECDNIPDAPTVTADDECDDFVPVNYENSTVPGNCEGRYTVIRSWSASDDCGNTDSAQQYINVDDTTPPTFDTVPEDVTIGCEDDIPTEGATASDNCSEAPVTSSDDITNQLCLNNYTIVRTFSAIDDCGNEATATQTITVRDTEAPTLEGLPDAEITVDCLDVPCPANVTATDNCLNLTIDFLETRVNGSCDATYTLIRTWTATDACGLSTAFTQTVHVVDSTAPVFPGAPEDSSQSCDDVDLGEAPTAEDDCSEVTIEDHSVNVTGSCTQNYDAHRNFRAVDACGNDAWFNWTVRVRDEEAPELSSVPPTASNECEEPTAPEVTATDNCDLTPTVTEPQRTNQGLDCTYNYTYQLTWTATDDCGNSASVSQVVTIFDATPPTFDTTPEDLSFECEEDPITPPTAQDNCEGTVPVTSSSANVSWTCSHNYVRDITYTATDDCGNDASIVQRVTVYDNTAPNITNVPDDETYQCDTQITPPDTVCVSDNCPGVALNITESRTDGDCPDSYVLTRTFVAYDDCGLTTTDTQTITVEDTEAPTFPSPPADFTVECELPTITPPTGSDNCGREVAVTDHSYTDSGSCEFSFVHHVAFLGTDACGNTAWYNYTITVNDNTPPTVTWSPAAPQDGTFQCEYPEAPVPTVSDNCGGGDYNFEETPESGSCDGSSTLTRTWTFFDACGNSFTVTQVLTLSNTVPPTLTPNPEDDSFECDEEIPSVEVSAVDGCENPLTVSLNETRVDGNCPYNYTLIRIWTATDDCGLTNSVDQTIHVSDSEAPIFPNRPGNHQHEYNCSDIDFDPVSASDNCGDAHLTRNRTEVSRECLYEFVEKFTYTFTDDCGNDVSHDQFITWTWNTPPTLSDQPANTEAPCDDVPDAPTITAVDGCGLPLSVTYDEQRVDGSCPNDYTLERTWSATDDCGLTTSYTQSVHIYDNTPPTLEGVPPNTNAECGFIPDVANVTASDNCGGVRLIFEENTTVHDENCCNLTIVRTWTAIDLCGNENSQSQTIKVSDTIPPEMEIPPGFMAQCPFTPEEPVVEAQEAPLALGWCPETDGVAPSTCYSENVTTASLSLELNSAEADLDFSDGGYAIRWSDGVGRAFIKSQVVDSASGNQYILDLEFSGLVDDNSALSLAKELNSECYGTGDTNLVDTANWRVYSAVAGNLTGVANTATANFGILRFSASGSYAAQFGLGANGRNLGYGVSAFLHGDDGSDSVLRLDLVAEGNSGRQGVECDLPDALFPELDCQEQITVNITREDISGNCPGNRTIVYTFYTTDESGNVVVGEQVIMIKDTLPPVFISVGSSQNLECDEEIPPPSAEAEDECDPNVDITNFTGTPFDIDPECPARYKVNRTYIATDFCGNEATATQQFTFDDTTDPELEGVPASSQQADCADAPFAIPSVTATDNCDDDVDVRINETRIDGNCPSNYIIRREWTATDDCGNSVSDSYDVIVTDTTKPVISDVPADITIDCLDELPTANPTCSDDCSDSLEPTLTESWSNGSCSAVLTRTWTCVDACGNEAEEKTQTITLVDTTAPEFSELPADTTAPCDNVPDQATLTATDNCDDSPLTVVPSSQIVDRTCANNYTIIYTWTVEDCAGNPNNHSQTVIVRDEQPPTLSNVPADKTIPCNQDDTPEQVCAEDNCNGLEIQFNETTIDLGCPNHYDIVRVWTAIDDCGLATSQTQIIHVNDEVAPTFNQERSDRTDDCGDFAEDVPPTANDDCDGDLVPEDHSERVSGTCPAEFAIHYAYRAVDECGNDAWLNYTVTVTDTTPPTLSNVPADATYECEPASLTAPTASDDCSEASVSQDFEDTSEGCPYNFTRVYTWTATDECGNVATDSTTQTVRDTEAPTWGELPQDITVNCSGIPEAVTPSCSDNCGATTVDYSEEAPTEEGCPNRVIVRTWTCTDECDHSITHTQRITVVDDEAPTLEGVPEDASIECDETVPEASVTASDFCDSDVPVDSNEERISGSCENAYTINRTWSAQDDCGNSVSDYQLIHVSDNTPPYYDDCDCGSADCAHCDHAFSCDEEQPTPEEPNFSDNCDADVFVELFPVEHSGRCAFERTVDYNWRGEDNCGNFAWHNYSYSTNDTEAPTFPSPPEDLTVECDSIPTVEVPAAEDNCDEVSVIDQPSGEAPTGCQNYEITHVFTATDSCGNSNSVTQVVHVVDTTPPTFDGELPTDFTVECSDLPLNPPTLTASDNCGDADVVFNITELSDGDDCDNSFSQLWTWTATDACGLTTTYSITVRVVDTTAPELEGVPEDVTVDCLAVPCPANVSASDNCDGVNLNYTESRSGPDCDYTLTRTWTATDACGNVASDSQIVHVVDTTPPVFDDSTPEDYTVECGAPDQITRTASDDCTNATVTMNQFIIHGGCPANYTAINEWTATDDCGHAHSENQTITLQDTLPPNATAQPPICIDPFTNFDLVFENVSINGNFFSGYDECSKDNVDVVITGCSSNQDALFGDIDLGNGFTEHCYYDASTDSVVIQAILIPTIKVGRVFQVTGEVVDECGHSTPISRLIYVALDEESSDYLNDLDNTIYQLPDDFDFSTCAHVPVECPPDACPCEDDNRFCVEQDLPDSIHFHPLTANANFETSYDSDKDETTFGYQLGFSGEAPTRLVLGIDLSRVQLVSVSPDHDVSFGFPEDSYVSGIIWSISSAADSPLIFSAVFKGKIAESDAPNTPFVIGGGLDPLSQGEDLCSSVSLVRGPDYSSIQYSGAGSEVSGTVYIGGALSGDDRAAQIPVAGAVVDLVNKNSPYRQVLATTVSDSDGHFTFHGVTGLASKGLALAREGFLRPNAPFSIGSAGELLGVSTVDISFQFPLGEAVAVHAGSGNDLSNLLILDTAAPRYVRPRSDDGFNGDSQPVNYWAYQVAKQGATATAGRIDDLIADAQALLPGCSINAATVYSSGSELEKELFTAALNVADGRGIFEPYAALNEIYIQYGAYVACSASSPSSADEQSALNVLSRLNSAGAP